MENVAKLATFNSALEKIEQAKTLLIQANMQFEIFVKANENNAQAHEYFNVIAKKGAYVNDAIEYLEY